MMNTIYRIASDATEKVYIGQTWQLSRQRFAEHKSASKCHKLVNAFNKYGKDTFRIEPVVTCDNQMTADYLEKFWMEVYDSRVNGYNIRPAGSRGTHSQETKAKMRELKIGKKLSAEHCANLVKASADRELTQELRTALGNGTRGRKQSPEQVAKRVASTKMTLQQRKVA